ncbi:MAG: hypothetical protein FJY37_05400 [Betaproteobacteria bacterium]|nr:hypothetical protein [Betaproteobacteria bacterium]
MQPFYIGAGPMLHAESPKIDVQSNKVEKFIGLGNAMISVGAPVVKAALGILVEQAPLNLRFLDLLDKARSVSGTTNTHREDHARQLGVALLQAYSTGLVEMSSRPSRFTIDVEGSCPKAAPLPRFQAESSAKVTSLMHNTVQLSEVQRQVLRRLDGVTDRKVVAEALRTMHESGALPLSDAQAKNKKGFEAIVDRALADFARMALLVPD